MNLVDAGRAILKWCLLQRLQLLLSRAEEERPFSTVGLVFLMLPSPRYYITLVPIQSIPLRYLLHFLDECGMIVVWASSDAQGESSLW
jgi:hypothetical protein